MRSAAIIALLAHMSTGVKLYEKGDWESLWWLPTACTPAPGKQCAIAGDSEQQGLPHLIFIPAGEPPSGGWPVVVFLHGQGESSGAAPLPNVALQGPPQQAGRHPEGLPFAVLSPQKPLSSQFFDDDIAEAIISMIDRYIATFKLDVSRVYLTGLSQGGIGTWGLASDPKYAHRFAAIAPVCGGLPDSPGRRAATLADTPVWAFHGANDSILPVMMSDDSVAALKKHERTVYAGPAKYTRVDEARGSDYSWVAAGVPEMEGHASWVHAYYPPGSKVGEVPLYEWFLSFARRGDAAQRHGKHPK